MCRGDAVPKDVNADVATNFPTFAWPHKTFVKLSTKNPFHQWQPTPFVLTSPHPSYPLNLITTTPSPTSLLFIITSPTTPSNSPLIHFHYFPRAWILMRMATFIFISFIPTKFITLPIFPSCILIKLVTMPSIFSLFPTPHQPISAPHHHAHQPLFTFPSYMPSEVKIKLIYECVHKEVDDNSFERMWSL